MVVDFGMQDIRGIRHWTYDKTQADLMLKLTIKCHSKVFLCLCLYRYLYLYLHFCLFFSLSPPYPFFLHLRHLSVFLNLLSRSHSDQTAKSVPILPFTVETDPLSPISHLSYS